MIIARAAKGAALLLMIFGVVALIGCQAAAGTAGPAGPAGPAGDTGPAGDAGPAGAPGAAALQATGGATPHVILINNNKDDEIGDVSNPATSADAADLFAGGVGPFTYKISDPTSDSSTFRASINDNNVIVVSKRTSTDTDPSDDYALGTVVTVTATDANGVEATKTVNIRTNRAPRAFQYPTDLDVLLSDGAVRWRLVVGTQSVTYGTGTNARKAKNEVVTLEMKNWEVNPFWVDDGNVDAGSGAVSSYEGGTLDELLADHTIAITGMSRGSGDDEEDGTAYIQASIGANGKSFVVKGLKSTWDADDDAHVPVHVEVTITDPGGLTNESVIQVFVDGAPQVGETPPRTSFASRANGVPGILIRNLASFYTDPEELTPTIVGVTVSPSVLGSATIDGSGHLSLTPNNQGTATITYYVRSTAKPTDVEIDSEVDENIDRDGDGEREAATGTANSIIAEQFLEQSITVTITPS